MASGHDCKDHKHTISQKFTVTAIAESDNGQNRCNVEMSHMEHFTFDCRKPHDQRTHYRANPVCVYERKKIHPVEYWTDCIWDPVQHKAHMRLLQPHEGFVVPVYIDTSVHKEAPTLVFVDLTHTPDDLKDQLQKQKHFAPSSYYYLLLNGAVLDDNQSLREQGVTRLCTMKVCFV